MTRTSWTTSSRTTTTTMTRSTPRTRSRRTSRRTSTSTRRRRRQRRCQTPPDVSSLVGLVEAGPEAEARSPAHEAAVEEELSLVNKDKSVKFKDKDQEEDPLVAEEIVMFRHKVGVVRHVLKDRAAIASDAVNLRILIANAENLHYIILKSAPSAQL